MVRSAISPLRGRHSLQASSSSATVLLPAARCWPVPASRISRASSWRASARVLAVLVFWRFLPVSGSRPTQTTTHQLLPRFLITCGASCGQVSATRMIKEAERQAVGTCNTCSDLLVCGARGRIRTDDLPITRRSSASTWTDPDGSSVLTLDATSVQTAPDGYRWIHWIIIGMIKAHPTQNRMARRATRISAGPLSVSPGPCHRWPGLGGSGPVRLDGPRGICGRGSADRPREGGQPQRPLLVSSENCAAGSRGRDEPSSQQRRRSVWLAG